MLEPPEEVKEQSGDYEEEHDDMGDDEYYNKSEPYHYVELERIRGIKQ
ncbi:hypothetical protein [Succinatimonas hippei]|nr:hypothetical protein [Succinatimonas hippei]